MKLLMVLMFWLVIPALLQMPIWIMRCVSKLNQPYYNVVLEGLGEGHALAEGEEAGLRGALRRAP